MHTIQIQFQPSCNFNKQIGLLLSLNAGLFTYMFSSFYVHSYTRKPRETKEIAATDNCTIISSNNNNAELTAVEKPLKKDATTNTEPKPTKKLN